MSTLQAHIPDHLMHQAEALIKRGWVGNLDELVTESLRRYIESHQDVLAEGFVREDVEWGLKGGE